MHRTLLLGTALGAVLGLAPASAQQADTTGGPEAGGGPTAQAPIQEGGGAEPIFSNMGTGGGGGSGQFDPSAEGVVLGSLLIGQEVRHLDGQTRVGALSDLLIGGDGQVLAFVVETEGKEIAVDPEELNWMNFGEGGPALAMNAAAGRLDNAPALDLAAIRAAGGGLSGAGPINPGGPRASAAGSTGEATDGGVAPGRTEQAGLSSGNIDDGTRPIDAPPQTLDGHPTGGRAQPQQIDGTSNLQPGADRQASADANGQSPGIPMEDLRGMRVFGDGGREIGEVDEALLGRDGSIDALVLDVGGFLGMGGHTVAVGFENAQFVQSSGMLAVQVGLTEEQLREQPAFDAEAYRRGEPGLVLGR